MCTMWYRTFGHDTNPLDIRANPVVVGLEKETEELADYIKGHHIVMLHGKIGSGKTSLLHSLRQKLGKQYHIYYLDAEGMHENYNIEHTLFNRRTFKEKMKGLKTPQNTVVFVDEAQHAPAALMQKLNAKWKDNTIKALVLCVDDPKQATNLPPSMLERIGEKKVSTSRLSREQIVKILKLRLGTSFLMLNDHALELLLDVSENIPRKALEYTEDTFKYAHRLGYPSDYITMEMVQAALAKKVQNIGALAKKIAKRKSITIKQGIAFSDREKELLRNITTKPAEQQPHTERLKQEDNYRKRIAEIRQGDKKEEAVKPMYRNFLKKRLL